MAIRLWAALLACSLGVGCKVMAAAEPDATSCSADDGSCSFTKNQTSGFDYSRVLAVSKQVGLHFADVPGFTRSVYSNNYALLAPESRVFVPQPGWKGAFTAHVVSPAMGAHFSMFFADLVGNSSIPPPAAGLERFVFVLDGVLEIEQLGTLIGGNKATLYGDDYVYQPPGDTHQLVSSTGAGLIVFEREYSIKAARKPVYQTGTTEARPLIPVDPEMFGLRKLLPSAPEYDFNIHVMDFYPGQFLYTKEMHWNQHGLVLLTGQGIYRLGNDWHPVQSGDAIWMAPYVPQWFAALGAHPSEIARYILYKDLSTSTLT
mmetsp:Transcript_19431/g.58706  ORF Transcript_19431/g.58706 Transcript_19431/m.58706 type:complete len:317 (+) Transcript_19431:253-1203(+)